jgi:hypothetical protein
MLSTLLLAVGAAQAAEKFDPLADTDAADESDAQSRLPSMPCLGPRSSQA